MARTVLQFRRGTSQQTSVFTGAVGELSIDTTLNTVVVHDGVTAGGHYVASLASPAFTGNPTAPTQAPTDNSTRLATTAYVKNAVANVSINNLNSDQVTEGTTNLFFTQTRVRSAVSASGSILFNPLTGVFSYTQPTNVSAFVNDVGYLTNASIKNQISVTGSLAYDPGTGVISYTQAVNSVNGFTGTITLTTDTVNEGTANLYFTQSRARTSLSAGTGITFNTGSGIISLSNSSVTINGQTLSLLTGGSLTLTSDAVGEGSTNLYFTPTRVRNALSGGTGVTLNAGTGAISIGQAVSTTSAVSFASVSATANVTAAKVGANNGSPQYSLDVTGDVNFTGALRSSGTAGTSGQILTSTGTAAQWANILPLLPNLTQLDAITFDGATTTFAPTFQGSAVTLTAGTQLLLAIDGVTLSPYINNSSAIWQAFYPVGNYYTSPFNGVQIGQTYKIDSSGNIVLQSPIPYGPKADIRVLVGNASQNQDSTYPFRPIDLALGL